MYIELIIFTGLQAAGKSTFFRTHFATTHDLISKDLMRNNKRSIHRQRQLIEEALQAGHSVVIDNTHPTLADRAELIQLGRSYSAEVIGYYFDTSVGQALARNKQRTGKERVPDVAIFATLKKLTRPTYKEGFNQLFYVSANDDGTFNCSCALKDKEESDTNGW